MNPRRRLPLVPLLLGLLCTVAPRPAAAQSAGDLLRTAMDRYASRMKGIDSYTVVQEMMGMQATAHFTRVEGSDPPVFSSSVSMEGNGVALKPQQRSAAQEADVYGSFPELAERATLKGSEAVDGHASHVIQIDDLSGISVWKRAADNSGFTPQTMVIFLDKAQYVPRRIRVGGQMAVNGQTTAVTMVMDMEDYRDIDGLLYPFHTTMDMQGIENAMSPEDRAKAQQSLDQLQAQMKDMPDAQKQMMEKMMGPQMERLQKMLAGGGMHMEIDVKDVKVNPPAPDGSRP